MKIINHKQKPVYQKRLIAGQRGIKEITDHRIKAGWITQSIGMILPGNWFSEFTNIPVSLEEFGTDHHSKTIST